jgi:hypothetical protein
VIDQRLHEQLVAEHSAIDHLVRLGRCRDVPVAVLAGYDLALVLAHHVTRGLDV